MSATSSQEPAPPSGDRREFLKSAACCVLGGACVLPPVVAGAVVLLSPIHKKPLDGIKVKLSTLDALPVGGAPRLFEIVVERTDAWTRHERSEVGQVFLERKGEREVRAFQAACPHLGGAIQYRKEQKDFYCPIHDSAFSADGAVVGNSPAARGLDMLEVEITDSGEVWVKFQDFKAGIAEKVPVA